MNTASAYEILATDGFLKRDLRRGWPERVLHKIVRLLEDLAKDPFQPRGGIKRMHGKEHRYRYRVGKWRLEYVIRQEARELVVERLSKRGQAYSKGSSVKRDAVADPEDTKRILARLKGDGPSDLKPTSKSSGPQSRPQPVVVEEVASEPLPLDEPPSEADFEEACKPLTGGDPHPLVNPAELLAEMLDDTMIDWFLDHYDVDPAIKQALHECESEEDFEALSLPESLREPLEDLMTSGEQKESDLERIYRLGDMDFGTLAARPLKSFLLHLDPEQQSIVDRSLEKGPYLVQGAAGTGKTLICLYRLRRMLEERVHESLLSKAPPQYLFLSYTNSLVQSAEALYEAIMSDFPKEGFRVEFKTVDMLIADLRRDCENAIGRPLPKPFSSREKDKPRQILEVLVSYHPQSNRIWKEWSSSFLLDEFNQVIYGNALGSLDDYRAFERKGRKSRLGERQQALIWELYEGFHQQCLQEGRLTFDGLRREVHRLIDSGDFTPRREFTYIFVDEVQDLPPVVLRIFRELVPAKERLTFASDPGQSIYRRAPSWSSAHPDFRFTRATNLKLQCSYRMSRQVQEAIAPLRRSASVGDNASESPPKAVFSGPRPVLLHCPRTEIAETTVKLVQRIRTEIGAQCGSIAIALRTNPDPEHSLLGQLRRASIPFCVYEKQNRNLALEEDRLHILTTHSIKGLEFPHVILPYVSGHTFPAEYVLRGAQSDEETEEVVNSERRLLYVACSRAMQTLWVLADQDNPSPFLKELDLSLWDTDHISG